jgi:hypothetical protein
VFPVLDRLDITSCSRLRLKPCPPAFCVCNIFWSDQVTSSLEEVDKTSHHCSSSSRAIKLDLHILDHSCHSIRLFHHFPALQEFAYLWRSPDEPARKHAAPHFPWVTDVGLVRSHISTARMAGWPLLSKKALSSRGVTASSRCLHVYSNSPSFRS